MRLRNKLLVLVLALSIGVPTFATVREEDTFTFNNISNTLFSVNGNNYVLSSDNTVKAKGTAVIGNSSVTVNTNDTWVSIPENISGSDKRTLVYTISENGDVYKGNGLVFTKVKEIQGIKSICISNQYKRPSGNKNLITSVGILLSEDNTVYRVDYVGNCVRIEGVEDVTQVYAGIGGFYLKFSSGRIGYIGETGSVVTEVEIPKDETFTGIFGNSNNRRGCYG